MKNTEVIRVNCPICNGRFKLDPKYAGRTFPCRTPDCPKILVVPGSTRETGSGHPPPQMLHVPATEPTSEPKRGTKPLPLPPTFRRKAQAAEASSSEYNRKADAVVVKPESQFEDLPEKKSLPTDQEKLERNRQSTSDSRAHHSNTRHENRIESARLTANQDARRKKGPWILGQNRVVVVLFVLAMSSMALALACGGHFLTQPFS